MTSHPLYDIETEQVLIGAFLAVPDVMIPQGKAVLKPSDFYDPFHQAVVELIYEFDEDRKSINPITLNAWLKHLPASQEINILTYLLACASMAPTARNIAGYVDVVHDFSLRRQAVEVMREAAGDLAARNERGMPGPILPALGLVVKVADQISDTQQAKSSVIRAGEHGHELLRHISEQAKAGQEFGVKTGIDELDEIIGGLFPETLTIIGGRPGMGKSVLGANLIRTAARQGIPADWWSIEMPGRECAARLQADEDFDEAFQQAWDMLHYEDLVKMRCTSGQLERATLANGRIHDLDINIFPHDRVTMNQIAAATRAKVARQPGPRLVLIDHMHILLPDDRYAGRRVDELSQITMGAKRLAKLTGSIVVMLAQLSRDIEKRDDKRPMMSDFRDSGSIEQDADVVLGLYRGEYYANIAMRQAKNEEQRIKAHAEHDSCKKILEIEVLKQRSGKTATAKCFIDAACGAIRGSYPIRRVEKQLALGS